MYIIDNNIYIHPIKCGGSSFRQNLKEQRLKDIKFSAEHFTRHLMSQKYKEYKTHTVIREPLAWYKSFYSYHFQLEKSKRGRSFNKLATRLCRDGKDRVTFADFIKKSANLREELTDEGIVELILEVKRNNMLKLNYFNAIFEDYTDIEAILKMFDQSLYQFFLNSVDALGCDNIYILGQDLTKLYEDFGLDPSLQKNVKNKGFNRYKVKNVKEETKNLVRVIEKDLYEKFDFKGAK